MIRVQILSHKSSENQKKKKKIEEKPKKRLLNGVCPLNRVKTKKNKKKQNRKMSTALWNYIRPEFEGFIRAYRHFFCLIIQRRNFVRSKLNLDGGTLNINRGTRPPASPLQSAALLSNINCYQSQNLLVFRQSKPGQTLTMFIKTKNLVPLPSKNTTKNL